MANEILKSEIKMMASQRLDDTDQGGGQMTSTEVVDGAVNNLFPDISRLDRVYGRVSLRKAFLAITSSNRPTYYGSHTVITEQAKDPLVNVCFFSSENWYDTRKDAQSRIESYMVKGPFFSAALWGDHYEGTRTVMLHSHKDVEVPEVGDVLVLQTQKDLLGNPISEISQYVRVTDTAFEIRTFVYASGDTVRTYEKKIMTITIGNKLESNFPGEEVFESTAYTTIKTPIFTTVAADASRYYGVTKLKTPIVANQLQLQVESIFVSLVPSAQSETAILDSGAGNSVSPVIATLDETISRQLAITGGSNGMFSVGEAVVPGTFSETIFGLTDNGKGDILKDSTIVGAIDYTTG